MFLKYISTEVRRVKDYDCEMWWFDNYGNNMVGMNIEFKVFGVFWIVGKTYTYDYFKD